MKAGVAIQTRVIGISIPTNYFIAGRVRTDVNPVSNARVSSLSAAGYRKHATTDDDGFYLLPGLDAETLAVKVIKASLSFAAQSIVPGLSSTNVDFGAILPAPKAGIIS